MTAFLFLQRFENGVPATLPYGEAMDFLTSYGPVGRGRGDLEISIPPEGPAFGCTVIGSAEAGISCIGFERPRFDAALRQLVWTCIRRFGCTVFDDSLDTVYVPHNGLAALPPAIVTAARNGVRQVSSAQQLWPEQLESSIEMPPRPGLRYQNANQNGPHLQLFDYADPDDNALCIEMHLRPEACNLGTLRVLRNLELRVDAAVATNPEYAILYRYANPESSLQFLESPRLGELSCPATIASPPPGEEAPQTRFIADREVFASALAQSEKLVGYAQEKYRIALDYSIPGIDALASILDKLHLFYIKEYEKHGQDQVFSHPTATQWAIQAGCYLGETIRRQIGGQWGYVVRGQQRLLVVRTHTGRICHSHLQVLDHICNGPRDSVAGWLRGLAQQDISACPRDEDLSMDIPGYCQILLGHNAFSDEGLPQETLIPRDKLDFSVQSLRDLDDYLSTMAAQASRFSDLAISNLILAAGAYFGEVIRSNAQNPGAWLWTTYDDFARIYPDFVQQRPRELGFMAFLDSEENTTYPLAHVGGLIAGVKLPSLHEQAVLLTAQTRAASAPATGLAAADQWPADTNMGSVIEHVRQSLNDWRRLAAKTDYMKLEALGPSWLNSDPLGEVVRRQNVVLEKGNVVWGALVQANGDLFQQTPDDLPAALVYSPDPFFDTRPQALRSIAKTLFAARNADAPEAMKRVVDMLDDEFERAFDLPLPDILTSRQVFVSTFMVFRKHLPNNVITGAWFPILIHADCRVPLIAPGNFWSKNLVTSWANGELVES